MDEMLGSRDRTKDYLLGCLEPRYHDFEHIGEGSYGEIYRAIQASTGQAVAIKIMREVIAEDEKLVARFRRELACCARISHPNVVRLIDAHHGSRGESIAVFELVPGLTLASWLLALRPSPPEIKPLLLDILDGLSAIHGAGVLHRDIKPANVVVNEQGATLRAVILDLGIGTFLDGNAKNAAPALTQTGAVMGTPSYVAPEQIRGRATVRSDLFSFGLLLLECMGEKAAAVGRPAAEVVAERLSPTPITMPAWLAEHPLGALLRRLLSKDESERPASARETHRMLSLVDFATLPRLLSASDARRGSSSGGASLAGATLDPAAPPRMRRPLTVLVAEFIDDALQSSSDCESSDQLLQKIASRISVTYQGSVELATGRQLVATFGFPHASEHDATRAAHAATAILSTLAGKALTAAIGIHCDIAIMRTHGSDANAAIVGEARAHAQRLALAASPGDILLSEQAAHTLGARFEIGPAREIRFGARTLSASSLLGPGNSRGGDTIRRRKLFGREQEMKLMLGLWDEVRMGRGRMALLVGEPGIGKSHLVASLRAALSPRQESEWLWAQCAPEAGFHPFYPFQCPLADEVSTTCADTEDRYEQLRRYLAQRKLDPCLSELARFLHLTPTGPLVQSAPEAAPDATKETLFESLFRWVQSYTVRRAAVLVLEDLHWADASTMDWLSALARASRDWPLFVIGTARPQLMEVTPRMAETADLVLRLNELSSRASGELLADVIGADAAAEVKAEVLAGVLERCDGIPLYIEEVGRELLMHRSAGQGSSPAEWPLPHSLQPLLVSHLDRLGDARRTAQLAAVAGHEVSRRLLGEVSELMADELDRDLAILVKGGIVVEVNNRQSARYRFRHAMIRDAAYESMLEDDRARYHAGFARALEYRCGEEAESRPDLVAHHHERAGSSASAAPWHQAALTQALQRSANVEAIRHGGLALSALSHWKATTTRDGMELEVWGQMTPALCAVLGYGHPRVGEALARTEDLARRLVRMDRVYPVLTARVMYHVVRNEWRLSLAAAESWHAEAQSLDDPGPRAAAAQMLGHHCFIAGRLQDAENLLRESLALYDPERHRRHAFEYGADTRAMALAVASSVAWFLGDETLAAARARDALAWSDALDHGHTRGSVLFGLACAEHYGKNRDGVRRLVAELDALASRCDIPMVNRYGKLLGAWAATDLPAARRGLVELQECGLRSALSYWASLVAELELELGALDDCERRIEGCIAASGTEDGPYYRSELLRIRANLRLTLGNRRGALEDLDIAMETARGQQAIALVRRCRVERDRILAVPTDTARLSLK
jgi:TOMM system kinase/cyclase fusion protein